jgi:hypothetical protein
LISYGQLIEAIILNDLAFVDRTLHMYPQYFKERPIQRLVGKVIKVEYINDYALGRSLDKPYKTNFYALILQKAAIVLAESSVIFCVLANSQGRTHCLIFAHH